MNLFKILFLFSLMIGLDYQGGAQNCLVQCAKIQISVNASVPENGSKVTDLVTTTDVSQTQNDQKVCDPTDCPPICRIICKVAGEKTSVQVNNVTPEIKGSVAGNLERLPMQQPKIHRTQSISLE